MAGRTLDELTATTTLAETDLLYAQRAAGSRKITVADFRDVMGGTGLAQFSMYDNAVATTTTDAGVFYKVAGTTVAGLAQGFTLTSNRATYSGPRAYTFRVNVVGSFIDGTNKTIAVRVAKNGATLSYSEGRASTDSGGRTATIVAQALVALDPGDFIEVFVANLTSGGGTTTAVDLNLIVERV